MSDTDGTNAFMEGLTSIFGTPTNANNEVIAGAKSPFGHAMSGLSDAFGIYGGLKQIGLAKDMFNFSRDFSLANLRNEATLTNAQLRDRQAARVAANPAAYQDVNSYMQQSGVSTGLTGGYQAPQAQQQQPSFSGIDPYAGKV